MGDFSQFEMQIFMKIGFTLLESTLKNIIWEKAISCNYSLKYSNFQ